ncbi:MAG: DNA recombination protein RmuC [Gammaproteobacteria bacterium]|nr:MAG: DNA recombination protein RmuC [Gammaproteobacteria bacterium]
MLNSDLMLFLGVFAAGAVLASLLVIWLTHQKNRAIIEKVGAEHQLKLNELASANQHLQEKLTDSTNRMTDLLEQQARLQEADVFQQKQLAQMEQQIVHYGDLEKTLKEKETEALSLQNALKLEHGKVTELQAQLASSRQELKEKLSLLQEAKDQLKLEFQNVANQLLETKSEKFTAQNKSNLDQLLSPLREQLTDFKKRVEDVYDKESKERVSLLKEITTLKDINARMSEDALKLTKALKGDNKIQGNWGEMVLERILETSGLRKGIEYDTQISLQGEAGERRQPDVIIRLPENKDVVVDSKVSLLAWEAFCSAEDTNDKQTALSSLVQSVKDHIKQLSQKNYAHLEGIRSLDFVLMFVPVEGAFLKVLEQDSGFFADAFDKNIMVVSPSTLLVTLRTIQNIWRYEYQNRNAQEIAKTAGGLHDQFVLFAEALEDVGAHIQKSQAAYETAHKRLISGRGNLVRRTQNLEKMGAKTRKKMPPRLVEEAEPEPETVSPAEGLPRLEK